MDRMETAKNLGSLAQLHLETAQLYEHALKQVEEPVIAERLAKYRQDHLSSFEELGVIIADLGASPLPDCPSRIFVPQGAESAKGASDTAGILKLIENNEKRAKQAYQDTGGWELPLKAREAIENHSMTGQHHLVFLKEALSRLAKESSGEGE